MDVGKNIVDVLLLYELSMSIGKNLDYRENCANFLELFLARKGLSAAWIFRKNKGHYQCTFALPEKLSNQEYDLEFLREYENAPAPAIFQAGEESPFNAHSPTYQNGSFTLFNLWKQGFLIVHCNRAVPFSERELSQLRPIIRKLRHSLEGATVLSQQQELLAKLEEQNRRLNDYAHVVSHDLKSPLRNINTMAGWIYEDHQEVLPEGVMDKLKHIQENSERMEMLISGLLRYSSVSESPGQRKKVDLNKIVAQVLDSITIPDSVQVEVLDLPFAFGDPLHFVQLFQNLIDNAIKSLDKEVGLITVGYNAEKMPGEFYVSDNGKGIEKKYHDRIFKIFQKLDTDVSRSGIGLTIVQKIVDQYKGDIRLKSEVGEGTTFYFSLNAAS